MVALKIERIETVINQRQLHCISKCSTIWNMELLEPQFTLYIDAMFRLKTVQFKHQKKKLEKQMEAHHQHTYREYIHSQH